MTASTFRAFLGRPLWLAKLRWVDTANGGERADRTVALSRPKFPHHVHAQVHHGGLLSIAVAATANANTQYLHHADAPVSAGGRGGALPCSLRAITSFTAASNLCP